MRRRILRSTMFAVLVAVTILGIPLGVFSANMVQSTTMDSLADRARTLARVLDSRVQAGLPITQTVLEAYAIPETGPPVRVEVTGADGFFIVSGASLPAGQLLSATQISATGLTIRIMQPRSSLYPQVARNVALVAAGGLVALIAGTVFAYRQSNRLARPLTMLAASAEMLGSGRVRPTLVHSGIDEIDQVAAELARSGERFALRLAAEHDFAGDVAHQLRTPLAALLMRLEEISYLTDDEQVRAEAAIGMEQVERVVEVLEDLRSHSRMSLGGTTELIRLGDVIAQQRNEFEPLFAAEDRALTFDVDEDTYVLASPGALGQIFATILENALRHGGGQVSVAGRGSGRNSVVITFSDEGEGVPDDIAGDIFERHVTSGKGTGIGLALARDLAAADGGRLELTRRVPAEFSLFLARVPAIDVDAILPAAGPTPKRRRTW